MLYPQELLFGFELRMLGSGTLTISDTLRFQLRLICLSLLLSRELVRLSLFELLALLSLFLLDLMFLSFADKPGF